MTRTFFFSPFGLCKSFSRFSFSFCTLSKLDILSIGTVTRHSDCSISNRNNNSWLHHRPNSISYIGFQKHIKLIIFFEHTFFSSYFSLESLWCLSSTWLYAVQELETKLSDSKKRPICMVAKRTRWTFFSNFLNCKYRPMQSRWRNEM